MRFLFLLTIPLLGQTPSYIDTPLFKSITIGNNKCQWWFKSPTKNDIHEACYGPNIIAHNKIGSFTSSGQGTVLGSMDLSVYNIDGTLKEKGPLIKWFFNLGKYTIQVINPDGTIPINKSGSY